MLYVSDKELHIIQRILADYPYQFYAFGSRVKGNPHAYSDLDLCYKEPIPDSTISKIREAFEESSLPFKVDIMSWHRLDEDFQKIIQDELIKL